LGFGLCLWIVIVDCSDVRWRVWSGSMGKYLNDDLDKSLLMRDDSI
jgi:hypothetical protein